MGIRHWLCWRKDLIVKSPYAVSVTLGCLLVLKIAERRDAAIQPSCDPKRNLSEEKLRFTNRLSFFILILDVKVNIKQGHTFKFDEDI